MPPYADITKPPAPLPAAKLQVLKPGVSLQPPLTRLGSGPGLILFTTDDIYDEKLAQRDDAPTAVLKWAEEGYTVVQISAAAVEKSKIEDLLTEAVKAIERCDACQPKDKVGVVCKSQVVLKFLPYTAANSSISLLKRSLGRGETSSYEVLKDCRRRCLC